MTCRTLSYQDEAWQLAAFTTYTLAAFSGEQIDRFIIAWYGELARLGSVKTTAIDSAAQHLQTAVRRPDLQRLAGNPLLLTVMALVHTHKGRLPEARALLYEETIDILLWRWDQLKSDDTTAVPLLQHLLTQVQRTDVDLKRVLWQLAFAAHRTGGTTDSDTVADIGELQLCQVLSALHPHKSYDWARQVMEVMQLRAGLLLERVPGVYAFPHRTFQEYLAGAHLSTQADFASQAARLAATGPLWREAILLAVGRLVYLHGETAKPLALVAELCPAQASETAVAWQQAWLAGNVLLEIGRQRINDTALGQELGARVAQRLVCLLRTGHLSPVERAAAGNTLARLGDPRFREEALWLPDEPRLGFVDIPAGAFRMGSTARERLAYDNEKPRHTLTLPRYYMARYPVTVAQWQAFLDASGYQQADPRSTQGLPTHPVVYVNWHDALAYCAWLTEHLRAWEGTPEPLAMLLRHDNWQITLPSEAEWEKAARGTDGRQYPWGKELNADRANSYVAGIGTTSVVGCFPGGVSPYGIEEMSGNVWEWTRSLYREYPYRVDDGRENVQTSENGPRVPRGGAFLNDFRRLRCAARIWNGARVVYDSVGFRVVVRPCL